jgi:hypothetical protein
MRSVFVVLAILVLTSCAADRYRWSMAHLSLSPRAKKLPQSELEQIVKLVVNSTGTSIVIGVGMPCGGPPGVVNVVADYRSDRYMLYKLKKIERQWKIIGNQDASPALTNLFDFC